MFDHIFKHQESWKYMYGAQQSIFDELQGVWKSGQKLSWLFDNDIFSIETKTNEKMEK